MKTPKLTVINGGKDCTYSHKDLAVGVNVSDNRYVRAGAIITNQKDADSLPYQLEFRIRR
jgi:phage protein D